MNLLFKDKKTDNLLEINYETRDIKYHADNNKHLDNMEEEITNLINDINNIFLVKEDNDDIRTHAEPDKCLWCGSKIGNNHNIDCVSITREVEYDVLVNSNMVGTFTSFDPLVWTKKECESHKNKSSWCACNALDAIKWLNNKNAKSAQKELERLDNDLKCACGFLEFKFKKPKNILGEEHRFSLIGMVLGNLG
jgi:hypothetical protein